MVEVRFEKTTYADLPHKFEAGTPNISGGIAFGAALDYMNGIGPARFDRLQILVDTIDPVQLAAQRVLSAFGAPPQR